MQFRTPFLFLLCAAAFAQPSTDSEPPASRLHIGVVAEYFPQRLFTTGTSTVNVTTPVILSTAYSASSPSARYALGVTGEYNLTPHLSVGGDFLHHQAEYTQLAQIKSGVQDPNSSYDNRQITSVTDDTRAAYWDVPLLARYYDFYESKRHGFHWTKDLYVAAGLSYRHVSNIRTGNSTSNADSDTSYNETPDKAANANVVGALGGLGYKAFEYGKFKIMFEGRYTRWFADTFKGPAYQSRANEIQIGISVTY